MTRMLKWMSISLFSITLTSFNLYGEVDMNSANDDGYMMNNETDLDLYSEQTNDDMLDEMEKSGMDNDGNL